MRASHALQTSLVTYARRPLVVIAAAWGAVALVAAAQTVAMARLGGHADVASALLARLSILPLWAAVTPAVLRSARRFPVVTARRRVSAAHLAIHAALGSLFIVLANVLIRLPLLRSADGAGLAALARSTLHGLAVYYPLALIVYGVIVAVGHATRGAPSEGSAISRPWAQRSDGGVDGERSDIEVRGGPPALAATARAPAPEPPAAAGAAHLPVRQWNRVHLVRIDDIDWIEAEDNYVVVHATGRRFKGRGRIADMEAQLDPHRFVRIHRSAIVHVGKIRELQPLTHGDHAVILRDGKVLRVARSRRQALQAALGVEL